MISERCRRMPAIFAPVHELSHQVHVLNAYMRESELMRDGLHPTLWAVLDEMIDMHQRLEPKSLFGGIRTQWYNSVRHCFTYICMTCKADKKVFFIMYN